VDYTTAGKVVSPTSLVGGAGGEEDADKPAAGSRTAGCRGDSCYRWRSG